MIETHASMSMLFLATSRQKALLASVFYVSLGAESHDGQIDVSPSRRSLGSSACWQQETITLFSMKLLRNTTMMQAVTIIICYLLCCALLVFLASVAGGWVALQELLFFVCVRTVPRLSVANSMFSFLAIVRSSTLVLQFVLKAAAAASIALLVHLAFLLSFCAFLRLSQLSVSSSRVVFVSILLTLPFPRLWSTIRPPPATMTATTMTMTATIGFKPPPMLKKPKPNRSENTIPT
jgi:hypothetical protein